MGKSELQTAYSDWNKRAARYASAGIPQDVFLPIAQHDFQKTFANDAQPMTNLQADLAVISAAQGKPLVQQTPRHSGGIMGDIGTVMSNIVPDASNIITGLPRGLYDTAKEIVNPNTYKKDAAVIGDVVAGREKGGIGGDVRALAGAPLLNLIPGLSDAAGLTTAAGRQNLLEHPVTSLADVYPAFGPLTRLGAGAVTAGLSDADRAALATSPSALAAAAAGKPVLFGLRAADRGLFSRAALSGALGTDIQRVAQRAASAGDDPYFQIRGLQSGQGLGLGQFAARKLAAKANIDQLGRSVSTAVSRQMGDVYRASDKYRANIQAIIQPILDEGGPSALGAFSEKIRRGDFTDLSPAEKQALPKLREVETEIRDRGLRSGDLVQTDVGVYSSGSAVAQRYAKVNSTRAALDAATSALNDELARSAEMASTGKTIPEATVRYKTQGRRGRMAVNAQYLRPEYTRLTEIGLKKPVVTKDTVPGQLGPGLEGSFGYYTRTVPKREADAADRVKRAQAAHEAALKKYQRAYLKTPPPLLHPQIKEKMRAIVEKDVRANRNVAAERPTDAERQQAYEQGHMAEFSDMIKDIQHTQSFDKLKSYMKPDDWKAAWEDVVRNTIKEVRAGTPPVYFHDVTAREVESGTVFHVQVVKDKLRDRTEGAYHEKPFTIGTGTVMNVYAGMTQTGMESIARDGMQQLHEQFLTPMMRTHDQLEQFYRKIAEKTHHTRTQQTLGDYGKSLMLKEWTPYEFSTNKGIRWDIAKPKPTTTYLPKDVAHNLQAFAKQDNRLFSNPVYRGGMKIFRTSVLYGPRHFAHIVIGGLFPIALAEPGSFLELARAMPHWKALMEGTQDEKLAAMPNLFKHPSNWTIDNALDLHVGVKLGGMLKQYWQKTGVRVSDGMKRFEDVAQSMYQYAVYARQVKHGADPELALETARSMVVNLDSMSPFERNIMKQLIPFYSFTRFAMQYMLSFPMDHPTRFSVLTSIGSQAAQEWQQSGLPMDMMSLIYFGKPSKQGNQFTVNYRNINPFRSVFNSFTFGGFLSSLNPAISSLFAFAGVNTLSGSGALYPRKAANPQTGGLTAARPAGDLLQGAEQFVPELTWPDLWLQVSSNVKSSDPQAFQRALWDTANLPFTPSTYNIPVSKANVESTNYQLAQQAVSQFTHDMNASGPIDRFNLVPFQGHLYTPKQFEAWYKNLAKQYEKIYPGIDPKSLIPSSSIY